MASKGNITMQEENKNIQTIFKEMLDELEIEMEWAKKYGKNESFKTGRVSGLETATKIIKRLSTQYK